MPTLLRLFTRSCVLRVREFVKFRFSSTENPLVSAALSEDQACIVVTHWEEEVPWGKADGIKKYVLQDGRGRVVELLP